MLLEVDNPTIRQTVFILNPKLSYTFDVNQTIQIHSLKKMIAAAAHLKKNSFSIYSSGKDYTDQDEGRLMNLFPNQQTVTFNLTKGEVEELDESTVKIKIDHYCPKHELKYLSYYCYTCKKSLCSICVLEKEHNGHDYREKYDYLQNSKHLVDVAFRKNPTFNQDPKLMYKVSTDLTIIKNNIKNVMFKTLFEMLSKVEEKLSSIVDRYNSVNKASCDNLQDNVLLIKKYCIKGLDELKDEICISNIIIDENVFLTFDQKYKELYRTQNSRFETDIQKFKDLNNLLPNPIKTYIDKTYTDIYSVLNSKLLNEEEFNSLLKQIEDKFVQPITEKEVVSQIRGEVDNKPNRPYSALPYEISKAIQNLTNPERNSGSKVPNNIQQDEPRKGLNALGNPIYNPISSNNDPTQKKYVNEKTSNDLMFGTTNIPPSGVRPSIMTPIKQTNSVKVMLEDGTLETKQAKFPLMVGTNNFYISSAHCNLNGTLYVTGGVEIKGSTASSSTLFKFDYDSKSIIRLTNMLIPRHNHTMISSGDYLYVVGGYNNNSAERYNIKTNLWTKLPPMNSERQFPILFIQDNYLYAFFGKGSNDKYNETIERLNLNGVNSKWENVSYSNPNRVSLKVYGCAVSEVSGTLYFFSGINDGQVVNSIFSFDLDNNTISPNDQTLDWKEYFCENKLYLVGEYYTQITEKNYSVISLQLTP